jgi:hypothetical protein
VSVGDLQNVADLRVTDFGHRYLELEELFEHLDWEARMKSERRIAGGSGTFSNWFQTMALAHASGQDNATWASLTPVCLALCTIVPDSSATGTTITEANYVGYARAELTNTAWNAAVSGGPGGQSTISNAGGIAFASCTAGSSTVIGVALCTALTDGEVIAWATAASTVVSTTQTPATIAAGALSLGLT